MNHDRISDFIDQVIEIEQKRDKDYKVLCHSFHKDSLAVGESPIIEHLRTLKDMIKSDEYYVVSVQPPDYGWKS